MNLPHWLGCKYELHKKIPVNQGVWHEVYHNHRKEQRKVRLLLQCPKCGKRWERIKYEQRERDAGTQWEKHGIDY